ncbi:hypothetical protein LCGC14_0375060 [marine sediment metagenome]|uniref:DUF669 domain-containing protein n=1 Tax=marine sediment metagenome TaxID=412755 RepID=A0A0F9T9U2_9ZZZZ
MGLFTGIDEAQVGSSGVYFQPGIYVVELLKVFALRGRNEVDFFIAECQVVESDNEKHPVGHKASWCVKLSQDMAMPNIKGFIAAVNGIDPHDDETVNAEVTSDVVEYAVSDDNPLAGVHVGLQTTMITTRKEKKPFTKHEWSPVDQPEAEEAAEA